MNSGEVIVVVLLTLATPAALAGLFVVWPLSERSLFRYRLWAIRDRLVDDLLDGTVSRSEAAIRLRAQIEWEIRNAAPYLLERYAIYRFVVLRRLAQPADVEIPMTGLADSERERLRHYEQEVGSARLKFIVFGSPSGWLLTTALILWFAIFRGPRLARQGVRLWFRKHFPPRQRPDQTDDVPLATYV
jgi:hypothetical protein